MGGVGFAGWGGGGGVITGGVRGCVGGAGVQCRERCCKMCCGRFWEYAIAFKILKFHLPADPNMHTAMTD